MGVAEVIRHFPFLSCAAVWRIEAAADSGRSPNRVTAPNVRSVARWNRNDRAAGRVRPDVIGVRARIIAQLHIRAEIGLDGGRLPGVPVVGHADDSAAAPFDDEQVRRLPAGTTRALLEVQALMAPDQIYQPVARGQFGRVVLMMRPAAARA